MAHPLEELIREAYAAFNRGDLDGYLQVCSSDFTFYIPGQGGLAGSYIGRQGMQELAQKAMGISEGTFQEDVEDVLANDHHAVVLAHHCFTRAGSAKDYRTAHVYEVNEGKLARAYEQPRDPAAFDEAWGAPQVPRLRA